MATETPSPEYKILEDSAGVQHVSHKDGTFYIEVRTSGWAEIDGKVYSWDTVAQDIPLHRVSEWSVRVSDHRGSNSQAIDFESVKIYSIFTIKIENPGKSNT
jgi:hypothetical protein